MSPIRENLEDRVDMHHRAIFGNPDDMKDAPGIIADISRISFQQGRTNEILGEVRDSLGRINWLLVAGFLTAIMAVIFKGVAAYIP